MFYWIVFVRWVHRLEEQTFNSICRVCGIWMWVLISSGLATFIISNLNKNISCRRHWVCHVSHRHVWNKSPAPVLYSLATILSSCIANCYVQKRDGQHFIPQPPKTSLVSALQIVIAGNGIEGHFKINLNNTEFSLFGIFVKFFISMNFHLLQIYYIKLFISQIYNNFFRFN